MPRALAQHLQRLGRTPRARLVAAGLGDPPCGLAPVREGQRLEGGPSLRVAGQRRGQRPRQVDLARRVVALERDLDLVAVRHARRRAHLAGQPEIGPSAVDRQTAAERGAVDGAAHRWALLAEGVEDVGGHLDPAAAAAPAVRDPTAENAARPRPACYAPRGRPPARSGPPRRPRRPPLPGCVGAVRVTRGRRGPRTGDVRARPGQAVARPRLRRAALPPGDPAPRVPERPPRRGPPTRDRAHPRGGRAGRPSHRVASRRGGRGARGLRAHRRAAAELPRRPGGRRRRGPVLRRGGRPAGRARGDRGQPAAPRSRSRGGADGSGPYRRQWLRMDELERLPDEDELAERGRLLVAGAVARTRAPLALRERLEDDRASAAGRPRTRRRPLLAAALGALAAAVLVGALVLGGSGG